MEFIESVIVQANAKVNLTLDIKAKRPDGYHEIDSIMQSVDLCDYVTIRKSDCLTVTCSDKSLSGEGNLAYRAARLFFESADICAGADVSIEKHIPVAAGLGGGSADAAAILVGLNRLYQTGFSSERLCALGVAIGADLPFCITGGTARAQGIGELLTQAQPIAGCFFVIVKAGEKTSTGSLYAQYDKQRAHMRPDTNAVLSALRQGCLPQVCAGLCNVFEQLVPQSLPLERIMRDCGALGASLSGSGPAVFGIFSDEASARVCKERIGGTAYLCVPCQSGCEIVESR